MNARNASPLALPLPLIGSLENVESFLRRRVNVGDFWASIKWITSVMMLLTISITLFSTGFILAVTTVLLAFVQFTAGDVTDGSLIICASGALIALWASGACWEKM